MLHPDASEFRNHHPRTSASVNWINGSWSSGGPFTRFLKGCRWTTLRTFARVNLSLSVIMISIGHVTSEVFSLSLRLDYGSPRADAGNLSQPWSAVVRRGEKLPTGYFGGEMDGFLPRIRSALKFVWESEGVLNWLHWTSWREYNRDERWR